MIAQHILNRLTLSTTIVLGTVSISIAQQKNALLDRAFWASNPTLEIVQQKVAEGNSPITMNPANFDATCMAITNKAPFEVVDYLLSFPENHVNKITHDGRTYIFWAAVQGNLPVMEHLVKKGANVKHIDEKGYSAPVFAAMNGQKDQAIYELFEKNGVVLKNERDRSGATLLLLASSTMKHIDDTKYFISKGMDLKATDDLGYSIFAYASKGGSIDLLKDLIKAGIKPGTIAKDGGNAFMMASQGTRAYSNKVEMYQFLEGLKLKPTDKTTNGNTALHNVVRVKDTAVVDYFLSKGLSVDAQDEHGNSPFMLAARGQNDPSILERFIKKSKAINLKNKDGQTALMQAVMSNEDKIVAMLLSNGVSVQEKDALGNDLSYYLVRYFKNKEDFTNKLALLSKAGFKENALQGNDNNLLHIATQQMNTYLIEEFAKTGNYNINALNGDGLAPLHIAASMDKDGSLLKLLIKFGADKAITTEFGESAYELASENELLQKNNVSIDFLK